MSKLVAQPKRFLKNIFSPSSPWEFLALATITYLINLLSAGNPVGIVGILVVALLFWWVNRRFSPPIALATKKQAPEGAKGLILLLSPYSPFDPHLKNSSVFDSCLEKLRQIPSEQLVQEDFDEIGLLNSNLVPQVKAVEYHYQKEKLKDVWLISSKSQATETQSIRGSEVTAEILDRYLAMKYAKAKFEVHHYSVDPADYQGLTNVVDEIFRSSGYKNEVIIADITGGTKMMSVALAMACVPPKRKMQYMDTKRDWQGNPLPKGAVSPVVIDVDPILYSE